MSKSILASLAVLGVAVVSALKCSKSDPMMDAAGHSASFDDHASTTLESYPGYADRARTI